MEDLQTIKRLLENTGYHVFGVNAENLVMEDPSCVVRSFQTFFEYALTVLMFITGVLLAGWAWAMIRGSKNAEIMSIANNLKNLILILGTICITPVFVNAIYGGDLIGQGCKKVQIPLKEVYELLDLRKAQMKKYDEYKLYEELNIYDTGARISETPYSQAPLSSSGTPGTINVTPGAISVQNMSSGNDVVYIGPDNIKYKHKGGSRSWRNNNPGNLRMSEFSRRAGAIGEAGGFAVFPDEQTGMQAIKLLLHGKSYNNLTIANAISRYAPPTENNTVAYQRNIERLTGQSINRRISDLSDTELDKLVNAIRQIEGWKPGTVETM